MKGPARFARIRLRLTLSPYEDIQPQEYPDSQGILMDSLAPLESSFSQHLQGLTIAVTQAVQPGGNALAGLLRSRGATVLELPLIRFLPPSHPDKLKQALQASPPPDWLLLTSPQAVKAVLEIQPRLTGLKVAAVGALTAWPLSERGIDVDFVPARAAARFLGEELPAAPGQMALHPTSSLAETDLQKTLEARGIIYQRVEAYRTAPAELSSGQLEQLLAADFVTLASGSAVRHLAALGGRGLRVVALGQQTAKAAHEAGFSGVRVAAQPTAVAMAAELLRAAQGIPTSQADTEKSPATLPF